MSTPFLSCSIMIVLFCLTEVSVTYKLEIRFLKVLETIRFKVNSCTWDPGTNVHSLCTFKPIDCVFLVSMLVQKELRKSFPQTEEFERVELLGRGNFGLALKSMLRGVPVVLKVDAVLSVSLSRLFAQSSFL